MNADKSESRNYLKYSKYLAEKVMLETPLIRDKPHYLLTPLNRYTVFATRDAMVNKEYVFRDYLNRNREIKNLEALPQCQQ